MISVEFFKFVKTSHVIPFNTKSFASLLIVFYLYLKASLSYFVISQYGPTCQLGAETDYFRLSKTSRIVSIESNSRKPKRLEEKKPQ